MSRTCKILWKECRAHNLLVAPVYWKQLLEHHHKSKSVYFNEDRPRKAMSINSLQGKKRSGLLFNE